jgi:hypothetical protein
MTTTASNVDWTHTGEDMAHRESPGRKPVPGQMGNVAGGGQYNQGIEGATRPFLCTKVSKKIGS